MAAKSGDSEPNAILQHKPRPVSTCHMQWDCMCKQTCCRIGGSGCWSSLQTDRQTDRHSQTDKQTDTGRQTCAGCQYYHQSCCPCQTFLRTVGLAAAWSCHNPVLANVTNACKASANIITSVKHPETRLQSLGSIRFHSPSSLWHLAALPRSPFFQEPSPLLMSTLPLWTSWSTIRLTCG